MWLLKRLYNNKRFGIATTVQNKLNFSSKLKTSSDHTELMTNLKDAFP